MMPVVNKQTTRPVKPKARESNGSVWDQADHMRVLLYGRSGTGKTTLWATFPGPILALVCSGGNKPGELRSIDTPEYREKISPEIITSSEDLKGLLVEAQSGDYGTVVLDHASGLSDLILKEILGLNELPAQKTWGLASQQQYGQQGLQCKEYFRTLLNLPCHVVIVAQERTFGEESASEFIAPTVGAALTPSVVGWLNPACDYVVRTFIRPKMVTTVTKVAGKDVPSVRRGKGVEYCLLTEPHEVFQTKFRIPRGRELPDCIVDPTFAKLRSLIHGEQE